MEKNLKTPLIKKVVPAPPESDRTDQGFDYSLVGPAGFDDFENNPMLPTKKEEKKTNFNTEFSNFKDSTEMSLPFTMTQFEDVLYVRENTLLTLQYIFYQKGQKTNLLKHIQLDQTLENGKKVPILGDDGKPLTTQIGCENYQQDVYQDDNGKWQILKRSELPKMSMFNKGIKFYQDSGIDYELTRDVPLMEASNSPEELERLKQLNEDDDRFLGDNEYYDVYADYAYAEGLLSLFKTDEEGRMIKVFETSFSTNLPFKHTEDGNMLLVQSNDHKTVSLAYFDPNYDQFQSKIEEDDFQNNKQVFKVMAWNLTEDDRLEEFTNLDVVNKGICEYYNTVKNSFMKLNEVKFIDSSKYVMLSYVEKQEKNINYEQFAGDPSMKPFFNKNNSKMKKATKYVIFCTGNGKPILEWGGCYFGINQITGQYDIHYLGLLPVRKNTGVELYFFYGGNILEFPSETEAQKEYDWTWSYVSIRLGELGHDKVQNMQNVLGQIASHRQRLSHDQEGVFRMRSTQFTLSQEWQMDVSICINMDKTQFAILNNPASPNDFNKKTFSLYHAAANQLLENRRHAFGSSSTFGKDEFMPIQERTLPKDAYARHGRNFQNKLDIYFMQIRFGGKGGTGVCMKLDEFGNEMSRNHFQITLTEDEHPYSMIDIICYHKKPQEELAEGDFNMEAIDNRDVIQALFIKTDDQQLMLKTRIPSTKGSNEILKSSKTIQWQKASFPIIAYNLGIHKIAIMNQQDHEDPKQYILELDEDESFICFLKFNKYEDFGFYPDAMRIYGCSQILYASKIGDRVHINLILYDPFYASPEIGILRSSHFIHFKKFNCEADLVYSAAIVPTKRHEGDNNFKIFAMVQHEHLLHRTIFVSELDDDNANESCDEETDRFFDGDSDDNDVPKLENVIMQQDTKNFLYYVTRSKGQCKIMEVNPRESELRNHNPIYEIKCDDCLGFQLNGDKFFFIDEFKTVHVLQRIFDSRDLRHVKELSIKEVSLPDFAATEFEPIVINEKYILSNGKIYYLYDDEPMPHGMFETEDLVRMEGIERAQNVIRFKGPIEFQGSNQFINVYKTGTFRCHMVVYEKPDSAQKTLINDFMHLVDVSTFLGDGRILVKCLRRFMIFSPDGQFIDEVEFEPIKQQNEVNELQGIIRQNTIGRVKAAKKEIKFDEDGNEIIAEKKKQDGPPKSPIPIGLNNMRDLLQFSQNNEYFIFINRLTFALDVYKLIQVSVQGAEDSFMTDDLLKDMSDDETYQKYQFVKVYNVAFEDTEIYNSFKRERDNNPELNAQDFILKNVSVSMENNGDVSMMHIINQPQLKNVLVEISMFSQDNKPGRNTKSVVKNFSQEVAFHPTIVAQMEELLESQKQEFRDQISTMKIRMGRLPKNLQDFSSIKLLEDKIKAIDYKIKNFLISGKVMTNYAVVWCGNQLKYSKINKCRLQKFENLDVEFNEKTEIQRVLRTLNDNVLQIVATEHEQGIFIVMAWNFQDNLELTMFQTDISRENQANYVVQGMYQKLNYYMNVDFIVDLEFGMPLHANTYQSVAAFQSITHQLQCIVKWANQRKVFNDTSQFLDIEAPYILNNTRTRMDMLFWDNFQLKGENIKILKQCMDLRNFSTIFKGQSLWHHYAGNADMIQFVHDKFLLQKAQGSLSSFQNFIPLMLLQPDRKGYTALYYSIQQESPKSFELMVHILNDFDNICISKMILKSLPVILSHQSPKVIEFFNTAVYQTLTMGEPLLIPWPEEMEEYCFPSNTSIISQNLVMKQMGTLKPERVIDITSPKISKGDKIKLYEEMLKKQEEEKEKEKAMIKMKSELKKKILNVSFVNDDDSNINRVEVVAHEFDWIFEENNLQNLIIILNDSANPDVLTTSGIKVLIQYMWNEHYQSAIINWIFFPYMIYLLLMTFICSSAIRDYLVEVENKNQAIFDKKEYTIDGSIQFQAQFSTTATFCFFVLFASLEGSSFISDGPSAYFSQTWNCIDFISLSLNLTFLAISALSQIKEAWIIDKSQLLSIGAYATFFMWCKMFYWMRLFESTAYYVTLIVQTISDCMTFMLMILIILLAFGNFFMVINQNMEGREDGVVYVSEYLGIRPVDALISAYFMGLGEFAYDGYSSGPNKFSAWSMFLLATFLTCVVFMNMLIAIMGETFGAVTEKAEQNGLKEQISLINDHIWLLDLKKTFKNQKYLIQVRKTVSEEATEEAVGDIVQNLENSLSHKYDKLHQATMRRMETIDNLTRALFKNQKDQSTKMQKLVGVVRNSEHTLNDVYRQIKTLTGEK